MSGRVNIGKAVPELYKAVGHFDKLSSQVIMTTGLEEGFTHLLRLRASQINQCAFCVRMHTRGALTSGETTGRISVLPAWRETEYFERACRSGVA